MLTSLHGKTTYNLRKPLKNSVLLGAGQFPSLCSLKLLFIEHLLADLGGTQMLLGELNTSNSIINLTVQKEETEAQNG